MKQNHHVFLIFPLFVFLLFSYPTSARLLARMPGEKEMMAVGITYADSSTEINEELSNLMGSEECGENDEECLKRRMIAEAHLDYIYTQKNKP